MRKMLFFAAVILAAVSCDKNGDIPQEGMPFEFGGKEYATLREAVNAVSGLETIESLPVVYLKQSATGDGLVTSIEKPVIFELNLGGHSYTLSGDNSIDIRAGSGMYLRGNGGYILSGSGSPALSDEGLFLYLQDDVSVVAPYAVKAENSMVYLSDSFTGHLSGDVYLEHTVMTVLSAGKGVEIGRLTVMGENLSDASLDCRNTTGCVSLQAVTTTHRYPVVAVDASLVKGIDAHVHSFSPEEHHPATCCLEDYTVKTCSVCGYVHRDFSRGSGKFGPCDPKDLVHMDAVEAVSPMPGSVEHWLCPHCGRAYSDPAGEHLLSSGPTLFPENYCLDDLKMHAGDDLFPWQYSSTKVAGLILGIAGLVLTGGIAILQTGMSQEGDILNKLDDVKKDLGTMQMKMDALKTDLDRVQSAIGLLDTKIDYLTAEVKAIGDMILSKLDELAHNEEQKNFLALSDKYEKYLRELNTLQKEAESTWKRIQTYAESGEVNQLQLAIDLWNGNYTDRTFELLRDFASDGSLTYLKCVYDYSNYLFPWEHETYDFIFQNLTRYVTMLTQASVVTSLCINMNSKIDRIGKVDKINELSDLYANLEKALESAAEANQFRDETYRRLNLATYSTSRVTFYRDCMALPNTWFQDWIKSRGVVYFPGDNVGGWSVDSYRQMMGDVFGTPGSYITNDQVALFYNYYKIKNGSEPTYVQVALESEVKFNRPELGSNFYNYFCPSFETVFSNYNFDPSLPSIGMLDWTDYTGYSGGVSNTFYINTVFASHDRDWCDEGGMYNGEGFPSRWPESSFQTRIKCKLQEGVKIYFGEISYDGKVVSNQGVPSSRTDWWLTIRACKDDPGYIGDYKRIYATK